MIKQVANYLLIYGCKWKICVTFCYVTKLVSHCILRLIIRREVLPRRRSMVVQNHCFKYTVDKNGKNYTGCEIIFCIGGFRGAVPGARLPYGSRFFHFDIQNFRNGAASGVHAPPTRSTPPLWEILDPPLFWYITLVMLCSGMSYQLYSLADKYLKYHYDEVTISASKDPVFPDITVCNMDAIYAKR